jgi:tRNA(Ile)-lysidine synthetase-like protein
MSRLTTKAHWKHHIAWLYLLLLLSGMVTSSRITCRRRGLFFVYGYSSKSHTPPRRIPREFASKQLQTLLPTSFCYRLASSRRFLGDDSISDLTTNLKKDASKRKETYGPPSSLPITTLVQDTITNALEPYSRHNTPLVVSVSGGCDSVALLHALTTTNQNNITAVHFHHHQRPVDADLDCEFVQTLCASYGVPLQIYHWKNSNEVPFSQAAARDWRRQVLESVAAECIERCHHDPNIPTKSQPPHALILTAHHSDDSNESLLLKVLRGVWIPNMQGMSTVTPSSSTDNVSYLRPFLSLTKQQLAEYLTAHQVPWREDTSNASPKYLRNRIRNELVPLLQSLLVKNPSSSSSSFQDRLDDYQHQARLIREDLQPRVDNYLEQVLIPMNGDDQQQRFYFGIPTTEESFPSASELVLTAALHQWILEESRIINDNDGDDVFISQSSLRRLVGQILTNRSNTQWTIELGNNLCVVRQGSALRLQLNRQDNPFPSSSARHIPFEVVEEARNRSSNNNSICLAIPKGLIMGKETKITSCRLRDWSGDSLLFLPSWRKSPVKLRAFLRGQGIKEAWQREDSKLLVIEEAAICLAVKVNGKWLVSGDHQCDDDIPRGDRVVMLELHVDEKET